MKPGTVAEEGVVLPSDLPPEIDVRRRARADAATPQPFKEKGGSIIEDRPTLAELERRYIDLILTECGGNKKKAAERLGIDRRTLYRALERAGVETGEEPGDE